MAGYSQTSLPRKLGIRPGVRFVGIDLPDDVVAVLGPSIAGCTIVSSTANEVEFGIIFATTIKGLERRSRGLIERLAQNGMLWACWPKKSSGAKTDLSENAVREIGLGLGVVDVKVCAVTDTWSGLKFVRRLKDRT